MRVGYIGTNHFIVVGFHFHFCLSARVSDYGPVKDKGNKKILFICLQYVTVHTYTRRSRFGKSVHKVPQKMNRNDAFAACHH